MSIDSEFNTYTEIGEDLEKYEKAIHDPFVSKIVDEVKAFNVLMETEATTVEDARAILLTLNNRWAIFIDTPMLVTGNVGFLDPEGEPQTNYYEDVLMYSKGFMMTGDPSNPDPIVGRKIRFSVLMEIPDDLKEAYRYISSDEYLLGSADVEQVILDVNGYSFERAKAWLEIYAPSLIDEVDRIIYNKDGGHEDALMALNQLDLACAHTDIATRNISLECLAVYLWQMLGVDSKASYLTRLSGRIMIEDAAGDDIFARVTTQERLIYIQGFIVLETSDVDDDMNELSAPKLDLYAQVTILNDDQFGVDLGARVPIDSFLSLESVRHIVRS